MIGVRNVANIRIQSPSVRSDHVGNEEFAWAYWRRAATALSTFSWPILSVVCKIWRCRFDHSTTSPSTKPIVPTPAPARYWAAGHPSPPTPMIRTEAPLRLSCPGNYILASLTTQGYIWRYIFSPCRPTSGITICRPYLIYSSASSGHVHAVPAADTGSAPVDRLLN